MKLCLRKWIRAWSLGLLVFFGFAYGSLRGTELDIDFEASSIEIKAKAAGLLLATFRFDKFDAQLELGAAEATAIEATSLFFDYREITSGSGFKDRKVRNWLEAEQHPEGKFILERVEATKEGSILVGQLTLHGQTHEARFKTTIEIHNGQTRIRSVSKIDYKNWGLPDLRILFFKVERELQIEVTLVGTPVFSVPPKEDAINRSSIGLGLKSGWIQTG